MNLMNASPAQSNQRVAGTIQVLIEMLEITFQIDSDRSIHSTAIPVAPVYLPSHWGAILPHRFERLPFIFSAMEPRG